MNPAGWTIVITVIAAVVAVGVYSRRYVRDVSDFLSAGRVCGRYVINVGDVANALSIVGMVTFVEMQMRAGFAFSFWRNVLFPIGIVMSLLGYCTYRFRETRALSFGQFLEMRYNRPLRIFAAVLRTASEILANMIMPAISARFFIYFLDLPTRFDLLGFSVATFPLLMAVFLVLAVTLICAGGTLSLIITDAIQGMLCFPLIVTFVIFVVTNFDWNTDVAPVMLDRVPGESFLNPYDIDDLRDFNLFSVGVLIFAAVMHRASWIGNGTSSAAKSPHEQKMAGVLGTMRDAFNVVLYYSISIALIVFLCHANWKEEARSVRAGISARVAEEVIADPAMRAKVIERTAALPASSHQIGVDPPLAEGADLDSPWLETVQSTLNEGENGSAVFQEFRTLYHQTKLAAAMRDLLPEPLIWTLCLLMMLAMLSTDDSRIFSSSLTIAQDVIMPLCKRPLTPKQHIRVLRWCSVGVGAVFFIGSEFMAQLDYIALFVTIMCSMWLGGCGPVMIFGLYSKFGTTAGAFASLISGMVLSLAGVAAQRSWAEAIYPWLEDNQLVEPVAAVLDTISSPLDPYVKWQIDPVKFPINSYEIYFIVMLISLLLYILVSLLTRREPFNLERMLHRGIYNLDGDAAIRPKRTMRALVASLIGITPEYTATDKVIAWSAFLYSFVYQFAIMFVGVVIWNQLSPWPIEWWSRYFLIAVLVVPGAVAALITLWFIPCGIVDMRRMFRDLAKRKADPLDDGRVDSAVPDERSIRRR